MLAGTLYHDLDGIGTELAAEIKRNCYCYNIVLAADTVQESLEKCHQTKAIFADAQMNAKEFASNSKELFAQPPNEDVIDSTTLFHCLGVDCASATTAGSCISTAAPSASPQLQRRSALCRKGR